MHTLALAAPSSRGPECRRPLSILFCPRQAMCVCARVCEEVAGGGCKERQREERVICSGGNSAVK